MAAGKMNVRTALEKIADAKHRAEKVRTLLRDFGQNPVGKAMMHSYSQAMSAPIDLSQGDAMDRHSELMESFRHLMELLEKEFLR
ncbi:MAG TPA: hypothetical protein VH280_20105 [Verrucomicrobiae bacterium]|nr:hypothetical protein [Verrucomicrobiae bacterium]